MVEGCSRAFPARKRWISHARFLLVIVFSLLQGTVFAQDHASAGNWQAGFGMPGIYGDVSAIAVHEEHVYVGGWFLMAGNALSQGVARWDRVTGEWEDLDGGVGGGVNGVVNALAVADDGTLYVGGDFSMAGDVPARNIAKWDGQTWSSLGEGTDEIVEALAVHDGQVYAGGGFTSASGVPAKRVARWDGHTWHALGDGIEGGGVSSIVVDSAGNVYAGGSFTHAGGVATSCIARWNGEEWSGLADGPEGVASGWLSALAADGERIYAGGLTTAGGTLAPLFAMWDGTRWSRMGDDFDTDNFGPVDALAVDESGRVYVGVSTTSTANANAILWDATAGKPLDHPVLQEIRSIAVTGGEIFLGGAAIILTEGDNPVTNQLYRYDGERWEAVVDASAGGLSHHVYDLAVAEASPGADPVIYAAGGFAFASVERANGVARFDGTRWSVLGDGLAGPRIAASALALAPDGALYVGGSFEQAGPVASPNIAVWRGDRWEAVGGGLGGRVAALAFKGDTVYAGGSFTKAYNETDTVTVGFIACWDGERWSPVGTGVNAPVAALAVAENGDLIAGGYFTDVGGIAVDRVARWDGHTWTGVGSGIEGPVYALATRGEEIYAGGNFSEAHGSSWHRIARWNGHEWEGLGGGLSGDVFDLAFSEGGDLYVAGHFVNAGGTPAENVARWDGARWHALDGGVYGLAAHAVAVVKDAVYVGGEFTLAGGGSSRAVPSGNMAVWRIPPGLSRESETLPEPGGSLSVPYPNPFVQSASVSYRVDQPGRVQLKVFDLLGREVATLVDGRQMPGTYEVSFEAGALPSGVYLLALKNGDVVETRRAILIR